MNRKTAREYAQECRRIAEQCAGNDIAKANWLRMAEAFEADADDSHDERRSESSLEQGSSPGHSREQ